MKYFIASLFLILVVSARAQQRINPEWLLTKPDGVAGGNAESWGVSVDTDGNPFWAYNLTGNGYDAFLEKHSRTSPNIFQSIYNFSAPFAQQAYVVKQESPLLFFGGRTCRSNHINLADCDGFITVIDIPTGDTLWQRIIDRGYGYEEVDGVGSDDSSIYVSGWSVGDTSQNIDIDAFIRRYDMQGNEVWTTYFGTDSTDHADGQLAMDDNFVYVTGLYKGVPNPLFIGLSGFDGAAMVAKFWKKDGKLLKYILLSNEDPSYTDFENALGMTMKDGFLYITGVTTVNKDDNQIFVAKVDVNMGIFWYRTWGGAGTESARAITVDDSGYVWVCGLSNSSGAGSYDAVLLKYSVGGQLLYSGMWGGPAKEEILDIDFDNGKLFAAGTITTKETVPIETKGFLMMLDTKTSLDVKQEQGSASHFYPNPMRSSALLEIPGVTNGTLIITDALGREVRKLHDIYSSPIMIERGNLAAGIYTYTLMDGIYIVVRGKFIVE
jgi:hypothetical protein